jgi:hypothetical protein
MSEDRFFQNIRSAMVDYSPEVPQSVYSGMRKKLWWSNFTRISITRFNIWYAALIVISSALLIPFNGKDEAAVLVNSPASITETSDVVSPDSQIHSSPNTDANAQPLEMTSRSTTSNPNRTSVSSAVSQQEAPAVVTNEKADEAIITEPITTNDITSGGSKDSVSTSGKAVKKGLKVKTFQATDK